MAWRVPAFFADVSCIVFRGSVVQLHNAPLPHYDNARAIITEHPPHRSVWLQFRRPLPESALRESSVFPSNSRSVREGMRDAHSAVAHIRAVADAKLDVYMRLLKESLKFVILGVVFRINIVFATTCIQLVQLIQSLVEVLQEVSFLDSLHLMILA